MGSCAAPSAKGDDKFITTDYLQQCQPEYACIPCINAPETTDDAQVTTPDDQVVEVTNKELEQKEKTT
ncbi:hypothetical protein, partial [Acinetobacter baumannii]|uniref:hypothetical protein n=1 Tax=Acinetobacter baumannii TaxID=470 RepID=UPI003F929E97